MPVPTRYFYATLTLLSRVLQPAKIRIVITIDTWRVTEPQIVETKDFKSNRTLGASVLEKATEGPFSRRAEAGKRPSTSASCHLPGNAPFFALSKVNSRQRREKTDLPVVPTFKLCASDRHTLYVHKFACKKIFMQPRGFVGIAADRGAGTSTGPGIMAHRVRHRDLRRPARSARKGVGRRKCACISMAAWTE